MPPALRRLALLLTACLALALLAGRAPVRAQDAGDDTPPAAQSDSGSPADDAADSDAGHGWDGLDHSHGRELTKAAQGRAAAVLQSKPDLAPAPDTMAALRQILAEPQFAADQDTSSGKGPFDKFWEWLQKMLNRLGMPRGKSPVTMVLTVLLLLLLTVLIARLAWELAQRRQRQLVANSEPRAQDMGVSALLAAAAAAAGRRAYREALRLRFLALVKQLDLPASSVQTNSELTRLVRKQQPLAVEPFTGAVACFEDAWYGGLACDSDAYTRINELAALVVARFEPAGEAKA
jgi:hypothetical protein